MAGETITYLTNNQSLKAVADAIRTKGGTEAPLVYPAGFVSAIQDIPTGGGGSAEKSDVNLYDYDGTIFASYSAADFASLTELPENPTHEGLTAQGWNWSLANAKAYVAKYGKLNIGQMYITDDGKTRVYIHLEEGRTSPMLGVCPNGTVDVDWGDGTTHDTLAGDSTSTVQWTPTHNYAAPGDYVIKLTVTGEMGFKGYQTSYDENVDEGSYLLRYASSQDMRNYVYRNAIKKIEIGSFVTIIGSKSFSHCTSLFSITIPNGVTSIDVFAFQYCSSLYSVIIPKSISSIRGFRECTALSIVSISENVTSIANQTFLNCSSLSFMNIPDGPVNIENETFSGCKALAGITIPDSIKTFANNAFNSCWSLSSVTIPNGVQVFVNRAFYDCRSLSKITIPESVATIVAEAFSNCYGMKEYHLLRTTPPVLVNTNVFTNISDDCIIYVPAASLEAYKTANNWSTYASKMQGE